MSEAFVICTKEGEFILDCIKNIKANYPSSVIIVVDSDSDDKQYMDTVRKDYPDVIIENIRNRNYEYGSITFAFNKYHCRAETWFFIQDSLHITRQIDLSNLDDNTVLVFDTNTSGWISMGHTQTKIHHDKYPEWFARSDYVSANKKLMTLWNSFIIKRGAFDKCINSDIFKSGPYVPICKWGSMFWERAWTTVFLSNKLDMKVINRNPLPILKIFAKRT